MKIKIFPPYTDLQISIEQAGTYENEVISTVYGDKRTVPLSTKKNLGGNYPSVLLFFSGYAFFTVPSLF